jgi:hypothetical protein
MQGLKTNDNKQENDTLGGGRGGGSEKNQKSVMYYLNGPKDKISLKFIDSTFLQFISMQYNILTRVG